MKHCIFDFDGVLVDSMNVWAGTYVRLLKAHTGTVPDSMVKDITPRGNTGAAEYCIEHGLNMTCEQILDYSMKAFEREYITNVKAKEYVGEALRSLKKKGISLHVLTASSHSYVDACLRINGVYELFDNIWSVDDFGLTKAQTEIYAKVAEKLNARLSDCTFFDDNYIALSTAKAAGMHTVGVYDSSSAEFEKDMTALADKYVHSFSEII